VEGDGLSEGFGRSVPRVYQRMHLAVAGVPVEDQQMFAESNQTAGGRRTGPRGGVSDAGGLRALAKRSGLLRHVGAGNWPVLTHGCCGGDECGLRTQGVVLPTRCR